MNSLEEIIGKVIVSVTGIAQDSEEIIFELENGDSYRMYHEYSCCEQVYLEDINGNIDNILNSPVLRFEEKTQDASIDEDSRTYTFYTIATVKGYLDLRWCGESNGCYSESVDFEKL